MLIRLRQGVTFEYLGIMYQTDDKTILIKHFYDVALLYFNSSTNIPRYNLKHTYGKSSSDRWTTNFLFQGFGQPILAIRGKMNYI